MKTISYSIICEDIAHATFIIEFLNAVPKSNPSLAFSLNEDCFNSWKFKNKSGVLNFYVDVSNRWFSNNALDLLFIIVDFDDWEIAEFEVHHKTIQAALGAQARKKSLILLPVRAIEFWLYHLKWRVEKPASTKNIQIEDKERKEVKEYVYGMKKPYRELTETTIKEIMADFDGSWLISRSKSFNHFHLSFQEFIKF